MSKKTTMTDIARALGVSQTLVSFVLSGKNDMGISANTKLKVLQMAEKMEYCPSAASKMLKLGRCGYAALVFADLPGNGLADIISGLNSALSTFGYNLIIVGSPEEKADIDECLKITQQKKADGFVIFGRNDELEKRLSEAGAMVVRLEAPVKGAAMDSAKALCEAVLSCGNIDKHVVKKKPVKATGDKKASVTKSGGKKKSADVKNSIKTEEQVKKPAEDMKKQEFIWLL